MKTPRNVAADCNVSVDGLIAYCLQENRVCPMPPKWHDLSERLDGSAPNAKTRVTRPVILAAWAYTSDFEKRTRLRDQIEWAHGHGLLSLVSSFLEALPESDWLHSDLKGDPAV
jgi:hypothetical protein